jgi:transcriptional regulator with XRE-family HTH domain
MPGLKERFGRAVRELRLGLGVSQEKLAQQAKMSRNFIGSLERGESSLSLEAAERIAKALGTTLTELIRMTESSRR